MIEKSEHAFKYTLNLKWRAFGLIHKGKYISNSTNTIDISGRYVGDIRLTHTWTDCLVYLDVTSFIDKEYKKYCGRPDNERIFRLGVQGNF